MHRTTLRDADYALSSSTHRGEASTHRPKSDNTCAETHDAQHHFDSQRGAVGPVRERPCVEVALMGVEHRDNDKDPKRASDRRYVPDSCRCIVHEMSHYDVGVRYPAHATRRVVRGQDEAALTFVVHACATTATTAVHGSCGGRVLQAYVANNLGVVALHRQRTDLIN